MRGAPGRSTPKDPRLPREESRQVSARAFLARWFASCTGGQVRLGASRPARARLGRWRWTALGPFVTAQVRARQDVYIGVATRQATTNGTAANLQRAAGVYAEVDRPPGACARLAMFPFPASLVVGERPRRPAYWPGEEPIDVRGRADRAGVEAILRRLATALDGDGRATDAARICACPARSTSRTATPGRST